MTDLVPYRPPAAELAVPEPHDIDSWIAVASDVIKIAKVIHDTPFVPEGLRGSEPAVAAAILAGRELGIGPMTALQHIHVIKGKPAQSAALMRALIQSAGHQLETVDISDSRAVVRGRRKGESTWEEAAFTADQAKRAGIDLGKYPQDKLYARATSRLARRKFADVIAGMPYSAEELEDGVTDEVSAAVPAPVTEQPKARTAQRKTRQRERVPSVLEDGEGNVATPSHPPLPPLPGEDEPDPTPAPGATQTTHQDSPAPAGEPDNTDYDTPGTVTRAQLTKLGATFTGLEFTRDERDQRLAAASVIVGRDLDSSSDLSKNEASMLIDTLERCGTRDNLMVLLATGELPGGDTNG